MSRTGEASDSITVLSKAAHSTFREAVDQQHVDLTILDLAGVSWSDLAKSCFVVGMGGQPRSAYRELESQSGIAVVHRRSVLPPGLRFLPAYRGAVRIESPDRLRPVFDLLSGQAMAAVYIFDAGLETRFVDVIRGRDSDLDLAITVTQDPGYLVYLVDTDVDNSSTPCWECLSFGPEGPWSELFGHRLPSS